ncbi:ABC transporter ATP-binding protein [Cellulomonas fimi]|uniref:ABC transporter related protein n=1 Tax=Cellulomonas fimi (strain ATCC 484 / DSM 20113 / JCM 1341 / CCUG 24087 / LMG 16345 / NBRC 15513 / NCIMB 8980 / NCTC 7547 / NRS-133) TaxID=590998 RepID=F4H1N3_CELFA|nr:ABC transporter related protein [Cellulomonas fimi ATCC 484]NNH05570.1 ABC transporter ATP-binding protein [Cellulomonas fimi]VEH36268.1 Aliphatic sulfonates import ATP-binding protein SsuB [Cellulomonas fimi]
MATHARGLTTSVPDRTDERVPARSAVPPPVHGVLADERTTTSDGSVVVRDLVRSYGLAEGDGRVLRDLDLTIAPGELVAILGRSGSGKSTLLRALAGLDHDVHGTGTVAVPERVSVVFQDSRLLPWARVLDNVTLGLRGGDARALGRERLAEVGLAGRERAWPTELSGGEQQRVSLARSLVREPQLLLADEPFGALDALTRIRMHDLLRDLCARHRPAVLLVTHDVDEAIVLAERVVVLDHGRIALDVPVALDGPRDPADPRFADLRARLLDALGVPAAARPATGADAPGPTGHLDRTASDDRTDVHERTDTHDRADLSDRSDSHDTRSTR